MDELGTGVSADTLVTVMSSHVTAFKQAYRGKVGESTTSDENRYGGTLHSSLKSTVIGGK